MGCACPIPSKTPGVRVGSTRESGDVVVFVYPKGRKLKDFIKRVVAVAGDEVQIRNKQLFVNGVEDESPVRPFC